MKIQIGMTPEMVAKVDHYANQIGVTRSAFCAMMIGQGVRSYEVSDGLVLDLRQQISDKLDSEIEKEKKKSKSK